MTLPAIPGSFRPGAPTSPQPIEAGRAAKLAALQFLTAEERSTAVLMGFFEDARLELEGFIRTGDLSVSDATFYRQLLDETNRIASKVNALGATWTSQVIPEAHSAGWRTHSTIVVNQDALEALSRSTLSLITATSEGMRQSVRQAIAQGILQGLSGRDVRQRIIATGLTNIPHWPSVEYRAGVIARTETMGAYNRGAIDGMTANGARFVRWITSPDEATCKICLPRENRVYRLSNTGIGDATDPWGPAVGLIPDLPAHPRCRCTVRAEYRGPNGDVVRQGVPDVEPKLPKDAMGGQDPPTLPPARGDLAKDFGKIADDMKLYLNGGADGVARRDFWRSLGRFDDDDIRLLTHKMGVRQSNAAFDSLLRLRYGIKWPKTTGWTPDLKLVTLRALERVREKWPGYVVDSRYLHTIGDAPASAGRFGKSTIARAFVTGEVQGNMKVWAEYTKGRKLRGGPGVDAAEEVILHEFMHTVHYRYGLYDSTMVSRLGARASNPFTAVENVDRAWHEEYQSIRRASQGIAPDAGALERLREQERQVQAKLNDPERAWLKSYNEDALARIQKAIVETEQAIAGTVSHEYYPTEYADRGGYAEDFAESGMLYLLNPSQLQRYSPKRFEFFRTRVFPE